MILLFVSIVCSGSQYLIMLGLEPSVFPVLLFVCAGGARMEKSKHLDLIKN